MKRKEQVLRYIARHTFESDDFFKVKSDFIKTYGDGMVRQSPTPTVVLTYDDYQRWLVYGIAAGDVVKYGNSVGIFSDERRKSFLAAYTGLNGKVIVGNLEVPVDKLYPANLKECDDFLRKLSDMGLVFSDRYSIIVKRVAPQLMKRLGFIYGKSFGSGVVAEYGDKTTCFLFCVIDGVLMEGFEAPTDQLTFRELKYSEIRGMDLVLEKNGKAWDNIGKTLKDATTRALNGGIYWYLTDRFTISSAFEGGKRRDDIRYKSGNYFMRYADAIEFLDAIHWLRIRQNEGESIAPPREESSKPE